MRRGKLRAEMVRSYRVTPLDKFSRRGDIWGQIISGKDTQAFGQAFKILNYTVSEHPASEIHLPLKKVYMLKKYASKSSIKKFSQGYLVQKTVRF